MPCPCTENVLVETKPCKSHKKSVLPPCKTDCCIDENVLDCCSPAYSRLEKLRTTWSQIIAGDFALPLQVQTGETNVLLQYANGATIVDASGVGVQAPSTPIFGGSTYGVGLVTPTDVSTGPIIAPIRDLDYYCYLFVNTLRYPAILECGKKDQLYGWLFDTSNENLEVFTSILEFNLVPSVTRASLLNVTECNLTRSQKIQLNGLNLLYKVSLKALAQVQYGSPRREGNIVSVTDKTGQKWTVAINRASSALTPSTPNVNDYSLTQYVIVACPSC